MTHWTVPETWYNPVGASAFGVLIPYEHMHMALVTARTNTNRVCGLHSEPTPLLYVSLEVCTSDSNGITSRVPHIPGHERRTVHLETLVLPRGSREATQRGLRTPAKVPLVHPCPGIFIDAK